MTGLRIDVDSLIGPPSRNLLPPASHAETDIEALLKPITLSPDFGHARLAQKRHRRVASASSVLEFRFPRPSPTPSDLGVIREDGAAKARPVAPAARRRHVRCASSMSVSSASAHLIQRKRRSVSISIAEAVPDKELFQRKRRAEMRRRMAAGTVQPTRATVVAPPAYQSAPASPLSVDGASDHSAASTVRLCSLEQTATPAHVVQSSPLVSTVARALPQNAPSVSSRLCERRRSVIREVSPLSMAHVKSANVTPSSSPSLSLRTLDTLAHRVSDIRVVSPAAPSIHTVRPMTASLAMPTTVPGPRSAPPTDERPGRARKPFDAFAGLLGKSQHDDPLAALLCPVEPLEGTSVESNRASLGGDLSLRRGQSHSRGLRPSSSSDSSSGAAGADTARAHPPLALESLSPLPGVCDAFPFDAGVDTLTFDDPWHPLISPRALSPESGGRFF